MLAQQMDDFYSVQWPSPSRPAVLGGPKAKLPQAAAASRLLARLAASRRAGHVVLLSRGNPRAARGPLETGVAAASATAAASPSVRRGAADGRAGGAGGGGPGARSGGGRRHEDVPMCAFISDRLLGDVAAVYLEEDREVHAAALLAGAAATGATTSATAAIALALAAAAAAEQQSASGGRTSRASARGSPYSRMYSGVSTTPPASPTSPLPPASSTRPPRKLRHSGCSGLDASLCIRPLSSLEPEEGPPTGPASTADAVEPSTHTSASRGDAAVAAAAAWEHDRQRQATASKERAASPSVDSEPRRNISKEQLQLLVDQEPRGRWSKETAPDLVDVYEPEGVDARALALSRAFGSEGAAAAVAQARQESPTVVRNTKRMVFSRPCSLEGHIARRVVGSFSSAGSDLGAGGVLGPSAVGVLPSGGYAEVARASNLGTKPGARVVDLGISGKPDLSGPDHRPLKSTTGMYQPPRLPIWPNRPCVPAALPRNTNLTVRRWSLDLPQPEQPLAPRPCPKHKNQPHSLRRTLKGKDEQAGVRLPSGIDFGTIAPSTVPPMFFSEEAPRPDALTPLSASPPSPLGLDDLRSLSPAFDSPAPSPSGRASSKVAQAMLRSLPTVTDMSSIFQSEDKSPESTLGAAFLPAERDESRAASPFALGMLDYRSSSALGMHAGRNASAFLVQTPRKSDPVGQTSLGTAIAEAIAPVTERGGEAPLTGTRATRHALPSVRRPATPTAQAADAGAGAGAAGGRPWRRGVGQEQQPSFGLIERLSEGPQERDTETRLNDALAQYYEEVAAEGSRTNTLPLGDDAN
mmetsp:Transcript_16935/g.59163  ORF Transcript_16935/g.59163 Transcript_16935/m.59163 type:complete len:810 (-) Transcript_16935:220-2649(-)